MQHRLPWLFILVLGLALPVAAADKEKDEKSETDKEEMKLPTAPKEKWAALGQVTGKVKSVGPSGIVVTIEYQEIEPIANKGGNRNYNTNRRNYNPRGGQSGRNQNPLQQMMRMQQQIAQMRMQQMQQLAQQASKPQFKVNKKTKDFDLVLAEDVNVRVAAPPNEFDEKGNTKKYTAAELKELKGPGNHWGFPADATQLAAGEIVQVFVYQKRTVAKPGAKKAEEDEDFGGGEEGPVVKLVYILRESSGNGTPAPNRKK